MIQKHASSVTSLLYILIGIIVMPINYTIAGMDIRTIIENTPNPSQYPEASAIILNRDITITLTDERHYVKEEEVLLQILSGKAKHDYGDLKITFDTRYEQVEIITAETFNLERNSVPIMEGADNEIIPPSLMDATVYNTIRQRVISLSDVEPGAILHWKIKRTVQYPNQDRFLWGEQTFMEDIPILTDSFRINVAHHLPFQYEMVNGLKAPECSEGDGFKTYIWRLTSTPMLIPEWDMTAIENIVPRLLYTTAPSWSVIADWFRSKFNHADLSEQLRQHTTAIITDLSDNAKRIQAIYRWVSDEVRSIDLPLGLRGYQPNTLDVILKNQYGDSLDKAHILTAMLRAAGFEANPLLFSSESIHNPDTLPTLAFFDSVGVVIQGLPNGDIWLDPEENNLHAGLFIRGQNTQALIVTPSKYHIVTVPELNPEKSISHQKIDLQLNPDGTAIGRFRWTGTGYFDYAARNDLRQRTPMERRMDMDILMNSTESQSDILSAKESDWSDFSQPACIELDLFWPHFGILEGDVMVISIPEFPLSFSRINFPMEKQNRLYPTALESAGIEEYHWSITLPEAFHVIYLPQSAQNGNSDVDIRQTCNNDGHRIILTRKITWNHTEIAPIPFPEIKGIYDHFSSEQENLVLLEKFTSR